MKALSSLPPFGLLMVMLPLALGLTGCSTTNKVDWNSRVGTYTYDQAILEFGPPDKQAKLSDGLTVAEWITRRAGDAGFAIGTGYYGGNAGVGVSQSVGSGYSERPLKLTFDAEGRLSNWSTD